MRGMSSSGLTFLDLPSNVRSHIYFFLGFTRPCPISLSTERGMKALRERDSKRMSMGRYQCLHKMKGGGGGDPFYGHHDLDCYCLDLPIPLLRVCRSIYLDTLPLLYGKNKFKVLGHTSSDLRLIRILSPVAIASLTSLLIRLNCWPCLLGHDDIDAGTGQCHFCGTSIASSDASLTNTTQAGKEILTEWWAVCTCLAEAVQPSQLSLALICDTMDMATAEEVMKAVRKLPQLKECTIRLSRSRDDALASLARQTMQIMTGAIVPASPFPFLDLPKELRLLILGFTHLGTKGSYDPRYQNIRIEDTKLRIERSGYGGYIDNMKCCYKCNDTRDNCCCPTTHASVSVSCKYRLIPFELFLVSKLVHQEAKEVFFSVNCFEFNQDHSLTLEFLSRMSPHTLRSFRRVRFMFTDDHILSWKDETRDQWRALVEFVNQNFSIANLCLIINTGANRLMCQLIMDEEKTRFVYDAYYEIVQQLSILQDLGDLHLEFGWFRFLEVILERHIMGEHYDSSEGNKNAKVRKKMYDFDGETPSWHATT